MFKMFFHILAYLNSKCTECGKVLTPDNFFEKDGLPYCEDDFHKLFSNKCAGCKKPIKDVSTTLYKNL